MRLPICPCKGCKKHTTDCVLNRCKEYNEWMTEYYKEKNLIKSNKAKYTLLDNDKIERINKYRKSYT